MTALASTKMTDTHHAPPDAAPLRRAPQRRRLAVALPVRPPESHHAPLPLRHINTTHLRRFVMLMQHESAIAAERHTGIRAACIHYAIRRLEDRLGTTLFLREAASMQPTAAARRLYPCAIRLLSMWDTLVAESAAASKRAIRHPSGGAGQTS
jgi:hypothetical protein